MILLMDKKNSISLTVPSDSDWGDTRGDFDLKSAYDNFAGKTNQNMQAEYRKNILTRVTDLRFMPEIPFKYYMLGFCDFIKSNSFDESDAPDVAYGFVTLIEDKLTDKPKHIMPIMEKIYKTFESIAVNQEEFGVSPSIYGDLLQRKTIIDNLILENTE